MQRKDPFVTGEYYHIYNCGIDKRIIFKSESDYKRFVMLLYVANSNTESFRLDNLINQQHKNFDEILKLDKGESLVSLGAWCLMPNHFHLIVRQEVDGGITKFMRKLGVGYSMFFNIKYHRTGALFGGLFKSKLINADDTYLKHLFGYLHLNPLDIKFSDWENKMEQGKEIPVTAMQEFLDTYRYSSYLDFMGKERAESALLTLKDFPDYFGEANSFKEFMKSYLVDSQN
ncbi:MAG: transposase [Minisyncoccia bacterium]